ncbi:hypothetical protein [Clostridium sp. B9]|uniref:hypothetical protein n=1 Tax=Clostridium sp. B9 TaxID=3423224 RepID=UPI003D2F102C
MNLNNIKNNKNIKNLVFILLGILVFSGSYMLAYNYNLKKIQETNGKLVDNSEEYDDIASVEVLFTRRTLDDHVVVDYKTTIGEMVKKEEVSESEVEELVAALSQDGYELISSEDGEMVFLNNMGTLEAGKYYIGEKDGYIAMFKAGEDGRPTIEKPEDVSTKRIDDLPEVDREKISNFEKKYDTREECEEHMTNYIS